MIGIKEERMSNTPEYELTLERCKRMKDYNYWIKHPSKKALKKFKTQTSQLGGNENCQRQ